MNLGTENLIPFKTKGITRNGSMVVFTGNDGHTEYPFNWTVVRVNADTPRDDRYRDGSCIGTDHNGRAMNAKTNFDIEKIIPRWLPQPNDEITIKGILLKCGAYGQLADYLRVATSAAAKIVRPHVDPGFFFVLFNGAEYLAYRDNMRLTRRPPTQSRSST